MKLHKSKKHDKAWIISSLIGACKKMNMLSIIQSFKSINQSVFSIQTKNDNIHTFFLNEYLKGQEKKQYYLYKFPPE